MNKYICKYLIIINNMNNTNNNIYSPKIGSLRKTSDTKSEYIYLLQDQEFVKSNKSIFKIGKIKLENNEVFYEFPDESFLIIQIFQII